MTALARSRQRPVDLNVRSFLDEGQALMEELDLDRKAILEDAYAIFQATPTREGAEAAAEFMVSVYAEAFAAVSDGMRDLARKHGLNRQQKKALRLDQRLATFDRHSTLAIEDLRTSFVESAVNGTMTQVEAAQGAFAAMLDDALFG